MATDVLLDRGIMGDGVANLPALRRSVEAMPLAAIAEDKIYAPGTEIGPRI